MKRAEPFIPVLAPGDRRTRARLLELVESVLGRRAHPIERRHRNGSHDVGLLVDHDTTAAEIEAVWELRSPRHVAAAAGGWLASDGDEGWIDPTQRPRETRMSVDFALPGPLVAAPELLPAWTDEREWADARNWIRLAAEWRQRRVVCLGTRLRASALDVDAQAELDELAMLPRPPSDWWIANRFILPDAERREAFVALEPEARQVAIVGAQRSGTSWAAEVFGGVRGAETMHERRTFHLLIEGFPGPDEQPDVPVWQATFLTCCRHLLASLSTRSHVLALVRDPIDVVRSMLFNWPDLGNVVALVAKISDCAVPEREVDQAVLVVSTAWKNLEQLVNASPDRVTLIEYETLCRDPRGVADQVTRRLGLTAGGGPPTDVIGERRFSDLEESARLTVERELRDLHTTLVARAA